MRVHWISFFMMATLVFNKLSTGFWKSNRIYSLLNCELTFQCGNLSCVLTCSRLASLRAHMSMWLVCLPVHVLTCLSCLRAQVPKCLACFRALVLTRSRANLSDMFTCQRVLLTCYSFK